MRCVCCVCVYTFGVPWRPSNIFPPLPGFDQAHHYQQQQQQQYLQHPGPASTLMRQRFQQGLPSASAAAPPPPPSSPPLTAQAHGSPPGAYITYNGNSSKRLHPVIDLLEHTNVGPSVGHGKRSNSNRNGARKFTDSDAKYVLDQAYLYHIPTKYGTKEATQAWTEIVSNYNQNHSIETSRDAKALSNFFKHLMDAARKGRDSLGDMRMFSGMRRLLPQRRGWQ